MGKQTDIKGMRFGKLTVICDEHRKGTHTMCLCACECGNEKLIRKSSLTSGNTMSCGCERNRKSSERAACLNFKHGGEGTRLYKIWVGMRARCQNPSDEHYKNYGGRGITVCPEWSDDFVPFRDWAISNGYRDDLTVDRIDVNGNYCPENCRWANAKEQANNRRNNKLYTMRGETKTVAQWTEILGVTRNCANRILKEKGVLCGEH